MAARHSSVLANHIEYTFWLVFDDQGGMRMARGRPGTNRNERAMEITARLPRSLFRTPELRATIKIDEAASMDFNLNVEAASDALKAALGVDLDLQVIRSP